MLMAGKQKMFIACKQIEEEMALVHKAVEIEMEDIEAEKSKTYSFEDIKKSSS
jgi:hypothetical protein